MLLALLEGALRILAFTALGLAFLGIVFMGAVTVAERQAKRRKWPRG